MVENGSTAIVEAFVAALRDLGYCDIVELIDPLDIHPTAGKYTEYINMCSNILMHILKFIEQLESKFYFFVLLF